MWKNYVWLSIRFAQLMEVLYRPCRTNFNFGRRLDQRRASINWRNILLRNQTSRKLKFRNASDWCAPQFLQHVPARIVSHNHIWARMKAIIDHLPSCPQKSSIIDKLSNSIENKYHTVNCTIIKTVKDSLRFRYTISWFMLNHLVQTKGPLSYLV